MRSNTRNAHRRSDWPFRCKEDDAVVEVTNRGAAIPPEQVERIFERFYRIDSSRHGAARNAGLGLAIVKAIMELHRGKVEVTSRDGRTTFTLYFPRGTDG